METAKSALHSFTRQWQLLLYAESGLYALGAFLFLWVLGVGLWWALLCFALVQCVALMLLKPWKKNLQKTSAYIDSHLPQVHFSTHLLLRPEGQLPPLSQLQRHRVGRVLQEHLVGMRPPHRLKRGLLSAMVLLGLGWAISKGLSATSRAGGPPAKTEMLRFQPVADSLSKSAASPQLLSQNIILGYPDYTGLGTERKEDFNIRAVEGTSVLWQLQFNAPLDTVLWESADRALPLQFRDGRYEIKQTLETSGFYGFRFVDADGHAQVSELYPMEVLEDQPPFVKMGTLPQYTYFEHSDEKEIRLSPEIGDDFGVASAHIVATVTKGSGEAVKFREEKLAFDTPYRGGQKTLRPTATINLEDLKMEVGDELYFYVQAQDNKAPSPNVSRSETYFAIIKDTATNAFAVAGGMGADLMPDYFRSQRQLILDTERLISERKAKTKSEFNGRSNELAFDQKSLRLKYGRFMGDESEMERVDQEFESANEAVDDHEGHDHGIETNHLPDGYAHDHDGDNEHNLVPEDHGHDHEHDTGGDGEGKEDLLHGYLHDHRDPEAATLFEKSLKVKLREAITFMWDAELHLRLYAPEESLPFQYAALERIQEIKNSARIYVHRIGFDPPPIKEEVRLSGDINEVGNTTQRSEPKYEPPYAGLRRAATRLGHFMEGNGTFQDTDVALFKEAGNELASLAIESPGRHLELLRLLKGLEREENRNKPYYGKLQKGIIHILPRAERVPAQEVYGQDALQAHFLKALKEHD
ncbi:tryptophan-rich sensory protein [Maribacter sp. 2307ULW6-5]|uniref:NfeD family protein n=1 Tax=Maribacter sp. 2307ULW6-5 TaxID=3386275 RepID=UPI0039BC94AB